MEAQRPSQYEFATLYEEWYLLQRTNDRSGSSRDMKCEDECNTSQDLSYTAALASRAGRMGNIQSAIMNNGATENSGYLRGLLEIMQLDDCDDPKLRSADNAVPSANQSTQANTLPRHHEVDMDAFFYEYPECMRPVEKEDYQYTTDDSESSSDDEAPTRRKKRALTATDTQNHPPMGEIDESPRVSYSRTDSKRFSQQPGLSDPNDTTHSHRKHTSTVDGLRPLPPSQTCPQNAAEDALRSTRHHAQQKREDAEAVDSHYKHTNCWEDPRKGQNPFQTAKEYAQTSGEHAVPPLQKRQQQPNYFAYDLNGYSPSKGQDVQPEESESPMVQAPVIPASLQRKFQPPKRGAAAVSSREQSKGPSGILRRKDVAQKSSSKMVSNHGSSATKEVGNDDTEEDNLPEELKRFGKDLVEKIQDEIMDNGEAITFRDIAGLDDAKSTIHEIVCWPMQRPDLFTGLRKTPNGLLLFGPPGTGKTLIGKAIAHESGATFFSISSSSLTSKWIGEGEKLVRTLFGVAAYHEPAVVFIDEIDSLLTQRKSDDNEASRRIKTEFLVQLDGTGTSGQGRVLVIGATNRPQELDEAARRRFVKRLYIPLPNESDRACLLRVLLEKNHHTLSEQDVEKLASDTKGFSGADLKALSADAAMGPIRQLGAKALDIAVEDLPPISYKHFRQALRGMHPSVSPEDIVQYEVFDETYGSKRAAKDQDDDDADD